MLEGLYEFIINVGKMCWALLGIVLLFVVVFGDGFTIGIN